MRLVLALAAALSCLALAASPAAADPDGSPVTEHQLSFGLYDQSGTGFQSQAGEIGEAGSEDAVIFQPLVRFAVDQSELISHEINLGLDVITAASPDAIDAVSQASKWQEALSVAVETTFAVSTDDQLGLRAAVAREENLLSTALGVSARRELADDNAAISVSIDGVFDAFDDYRRDGRTIDERAYRTTTAANLSLSQVLSPTTVAWATYGLTVQSGQLATPHNTAPIDLGGRYKERFPDRRWRHAFGLRIAQRLPALRLTARGGYRFYRDSFDVNAHTADVELHRDLGDHAVARISYRLHRQSAASFFSESFPRNMEVDEPRTSDSDLDQLWAHEAGARLALGLGALHPGLSGITADLSLFRYVRSNGLAVSYGAAGYTVVFD
jgi:hypothetical protein